MIQNFLEYIELNIISALKKQKVFPTKYEDLYNKFVEYIRQSPENVLHLIDLLGDKYIHNKNPETQDYIHNFITNISVDKIKEHTKTQQPVKKLIIYHITMGLKQLLIDLFKEHHKIDIDIPKDEIENPMDLILVEYLFRHYFVKLKDINDKTVLSNYIKRNNISNVNDVSLEYITRIKK